MPKTFHFLAGLPRSGSTVLAALLNQHPDVHTSPTSGMGEVMFNTFKAWQNSSAEQAAPDVDQIKTVLRSIMDAKYAKVDKPVVIDKARNWAEASTIQVLKDLLPYKPKIIATVRDVDACAASFVRIAKPNDLEDFLRNDGLIGHLKESYKVLLSGYNLDPSCFLFVEYEDMMADPKKQLARIHEFLELSEFDYDFDHLDKYAPKERDEEVWQVPGLHDVAPKLGKRHDERPEDVLQHMHASFVQPRFWRGEDKPNLEVHKLDLMLAQGLMGNLDEAKRIGEQLAFEEPKNHRAAFNRGWYALRDGHLLDGMKLIDRGRIEQVFGNGKPSVPTEMWDGEKQGTILLNLEGGLGDQIHSARFAKDIAKRGNTVIVACSGPLAQVVRGIEGVTAVVQHEAAFGVVHDYWVPSMSAVVPLQYQYADLDGSAYIPKPEVEKGSKFRIGLRWQGNPQFEHEQHRQFPPELMFNALKGMDAEFISLQRDEGAEHKPAWVKEVPLNHWAETQSAIAFCDLVITSCTSVAHLAGAMGVETWIIVPILPYYLWAKPGEKTEWYDSVRLFRQEIYGTWEHPFRKIEQQLRCKIGGDNANTSRILDSRRERPSQGRMGLQANHWPQSGLAGLA